MNINSPAQSEGNILKIIEDSGPATSTPQSSIPKSTREPNTTPTSPSNKKRFLFKLPHFRFKPKSKTKPNTSSASGISAKKSKRRLKKIILLLLLLLLPLIIAVAASAYPLLQIKAQTPAVETSAREVYDALKHQNLILAREKLGNTKSSLDSIAHSYHLLSWYQFTPLRWHYLDGQRALAAAQSGLQAADTLLASIEPYADVIGFTGEGTFTGGTAEERIVKILETVDKIVPALDSVAADLQTIQTELSSINPQRYPFTIKGYQVEELLSKAQNYSQAAVIAVTDVKPILEKLPQIAALEEEKKYLVLFQNDAELRPTGGFMTAYAVLRVDKGRVYPENNDDIYHLDEKFTKRLQPPDPIKEHLNVFYWNLRDMNWSPDFKTSMDTFLQYYQDIPGEAKDLDGVIAIDTQMLADLVSVLGPLEVPGFGIFSSDTDERCDCPQVIYKLEDMASRPVAHVITDRKAFLGPMMQTLLLQAYGSPKNVWPNLFQTGIQNIIDKHVLFYFFDESAQQAAESVNITGNLRSSDSDYFMVVDTNLGGAKQNLFITEDIAMDVQVADGKVTHNVTLTYDNPAPWSNCNLEAGELCLNGRYIDYVRIYLPKGSTLVEALGFNEDTVKTSEDLDKTVVEGVFEFDPESRAKLKLTYESAYQPADDYQLLIQKQAGKKQPTYTVTFNNTDQQEFNLNTDKEIRFEL